MKTLRETLNEIYPHLDNKVTKSPSDKLRLMATATGLAEMARDDDLFISDEDLLSLPQSARQIALMGFGILILGGLHEGE